MSNRRNTYNGYEEKMLTGLEIKKYFENAYECFGRHHEKVSSHRINFNKYYHKIKDEDTYRVFVNDMFCKIMDAETDASLYFFGYTMEKPLWAND